MAYWIVKTEPTSYSWNDLEAEGEAIWDGIRNYQARNYLLQMKQGDQVLVYHSGVEKAVVGLAQVSEEAFPEPQEPAWMAVKLKAIHRLAIPLSLTRLQTEPTLAGISLLKQHRLSVHSLSEEAYSMICKLSS